MAKQEVLWWSENVREVGKYPIVNPATSTVTECQVVSDGSGTGGFYSYEVETQKRLAGRSYTSHESKQSSTYGELVAIHDTWTIEVNLEKFRRKKVCHFSDNKALVFIIAKGGMASLAL